MAHIITYLYCISHRYCGTTSNGTVQCRAILLICTVDLPARAMVCNMKQYNVECHVVHVWRRGTILSQVIN